MRQQSHPAPEVQELEPFRYGVVRDKGHWSHSCKTKAKYMLKRPTHLTKDDTDLRVTICHIQGHGSFEPRLTFSARSLVACCHCNCQISKVTSLLMYCLTAILTSLISQALLQAALDKNERGFTGWFFQYEFSNLPVSAARSSREAQRRFVQCQCQSIVSMATTALACRIERHWHRGIPGWLIGNHREAQAYQFV
jgi:hypothetical protein